MICNTFVILTESVSESTAISLTSANAALPYTRAVVRESRDGDRDGDGDGDGDGN